MARDKEPFLTRWSRRKLQDKRAPEATPPAKPAPPPELPPVDQLGFDSDYRGFLHPKVDETLRRQALKKLFSSAAFREPCMLDDFNEDYTLLESLAPEAADKLAHAKRVLLGEPEAPPAPEAPREGEPGKAPTQVAQAETPPADEGPAKDDGAPG